MLNDEVSFLGSVSAKGTRQLPVFLSGMSRRYLDGRAGQGRDTCVDWLGRYQDALVASLDPARDGNALAYPSYTAVTEPPNERGTPFPSRTFRRPLSN